MFLQKQEKMPRERRRVPCGIKKLHIRQPKRVHRREIGAKDRQTVQHAFEHRKPEALLFAGKPEYITQSV